MDQGGLPNNAAPHRAELRAKRHAWSHTRAQGFLDGEMARRRGTVPSIYVRVGMDEYCMGFRAGYFVRGASQRSDLAQWPARPLQSQVIAPPAQLENKASALAAVR